MKQCINAVDRNDLIHCTVCINSKQESMEQIEWQRQQMTVHKERGQDTALHRRAES